MSFATSPAFEETAVTDVGAPARYHNIGFQSLSASQEPFEAQTMQRPRRRIAGNDRRDLARNVRAYSITQGEYLKLTQQAMREDAGDSPGGAKRIANKVECSEKTAQNWLDGKATPSGILDLRAMHSIPAYAALKREIAAMEMDMDPRVQAKMQELYRLTLDLAGEQE